MRTRDRARLTLAILLAAGAFCLRGSAAQPAAKATPPCGGCNNCQSPRDLPASMPDAPSSIVRPGPDDATIIYTPTGASLHRCSQHFHCSIENRQQCNSAGATRAHKECGPNHVGDWVEIHTVYAPSLGTGCNGNYESTDCCEGDPKVVLAYHARVTSDTLPGPVPVYWGHVPGPVPAFWGTTAAEWSGSTTGPPKPAEPNGCKPAALWSFALGCDFRVSLGQLALFKHPEPARGLQPPARLSNDLRRVPRAPTP